CCYILISSYFILRVLCASVVKFPPPCPPSSLCVPSPSPSLFHILTASLKRCQQKKAGCYADTAIGYVERRPCVFPHIKVQKIGYRAEKNPINQITSNTRNQQGKRNFRHSSHSPRNRACKATPNK